MLPRLRVGLTGGIASGKSTVSQRFVELQVPVVDADLAAREVVDRDTPGLGRVVQRFGGDILCPDGHLNRAALRGVIFKDPQARRDLNAILHPLIRDAMEREVATAQGPYVVLAIPLLIESGSPRERIERILVIDIDEPTQLQRLMARDDSTIDQARAILAAQATRAARLAAADDVIENAGSVADLRQAVDRQHQHYLDLAAARSVSSS